MEEYEKAKQFWNETLSGEPGKIEAKFIDNEYFNETVMKLYKEDAILCDFGSGSGWGLFELYYTKKFQHGYGLDQSQNGVQFSNACAKLSGLENVISFEKKVLEDYPDEFFDAMLSVNTLDVIPLDVTKAILKEMYRTVKKSGKLMISLNPFLDEEFNKRAQMTSIGSHMYTKNGILRCLNFTTEEWVSMFQEYFTVVETKDYQLSFEQGYTRRMFVLQKQ